MAEFDLIAAIAARASGAPGVVLGIGDDAALLQPPPGQQLVVTADTLNAGVHFPPRTLPADIGWKALAVNLSDLAAMGARPAWCTLSLSLPGHDPRWVDGFLDGFLALANAHGIALVGGDTTQGPLSIAVTAMGLVEAGTALRRDQARVGDEVWVTGSLGDAAAALALGGHMPMPAGASPAQDAAAIARLQSRLDRPTPRVAAGRALRGLAHACADVSDGLVADLGHICTRSGVGARIELDALPASSALQRVFAGHSAIFQASGGDDYELCFTAPAAAGAAIAELAAGLELACTRIGVIEAGSKVRVLDPAGQPWSPARAGWVHFS
jgi:thiamine-monophosphate kinase